MAASILPINRPVTVARDLNGTDIRDVDFSLFDLFASASRQGLMLIEGRTLTNCRIQGPAIMLAAEGVTFDDVNFGDSRGDIRNLLLRPEGTKAIGAIPFRNCAFVGCEFYGVGFTGPPEFLDQMRTLTGTPRPAA